MELIALVAVAVAVAIAIVIYRSDVAGWNRTIKRISTGFRASFEPSQEAKVLQKSKKDKDMERVSWENAFLGKTEEDDDKHRIVKTSYELIDNRVYWPYWVCACGVARREPCDTDGLAQAEKDALADAQEHVKELNAIERKMRNNGNFNF